MIDFNQDVVCENIVLRFLRETSSEITTKHGYN
jgi:hypothetical protein